MNPQRNLKSSALSLVKRNSLNIQKICIFLILYAISHLSICWMHKRSIQQYHKVGWALVFENGHQDLELNNIRKALLQLKWSTDFISGTWWNSEG